PGARTAPRSPPPASRRETGRMWPSPPADRAAARAATARRCRGSTSHSRVAAAAPASPAATGSACRNLRRTATDRRPRAPRRRAPPRVLAGSRGCRTAAPTWLDSLTNVKIVCLIKQVPRGDAIRFDEETKSLVREGVPLELNRFDAYAIAHAVRLGDEVVAMTMGPPQAEEALRAALALGAHRAIQLSDRAFALADTLG